MVASVVFTAAACTSSSGAGGQSSTGDTAGGVSIEIVTPADGAQVSIPFDVQLRSSGPLGEPGSGNHHAHLYFDTGTDASDYDIVYGTTWKVTRQLSPGEHKITVALANPDHSLAGPTQQITVNVGAGGGSGGSGASPAPTAPPIRY